MANPLAERIRESRKKLENPYAYLDDKGAYYAIADSAVKPTKDGLATAGEIVKSRQNLDNPYAYLDGEGAYGALMAATGNRARGGPRITAESLRGSVGRNRQHQKRARYSPREIESLAKALHRQIWIHREEIWPQGSPANPIDMLDPRIALESIGYDFQMPESLGQFEGTEIEVAGIIDGHNKRIKISRRFPICVRNFTAAHELGHAVLHGEHGLHRDRPLDGANASVGRDAAEVAADTFAAYFLMPAKLVRTAFRKTFSVDRFRISEETLFALGLEDNSKIRSELRERRSLSRLLARTQQYNGQHFVSLAERFHVSTEALAIRLEELRLLD